MDITEYKKRYNSTEKFNSKINSYNTKYVSSPAEQAVAAIPEISQERVENKLNSLINNTLKKIKNTPYWNDFTNEEQEKMISRYFDIKIKSEKYSKINISIKEKLSFMEDVLARAKKL